MLGKMFTRAFAAGVPQRFPGGRYFRLLDCNGAVTVTFIDKEGQTIGEFEGALGGFSIDANDFGETSAKLTPEFSFVIVESASSQTIILATSKVRIGFDRLTGTITTALESGDVVADTGAVAVTAVATALIALGTGRTSCRFYNNGINSVAIVGVSGTYANAAIYLAPGEMWIETASANAAWYAICNTGLASSVNVQTTSI